MKFISQDPKSLREIENFERSKVREIESKGLEPKLHDLALSMGENETLYVKIVTLLKRLQDIMLSTSISYFV